MTFRTTSIAPLLALTSVAMAEEEVSDFSFSLQVEYQYIHTGAFDTDAGPFDIGETDAHILLLSGDFSVGERWRVFASIPYVQKRHQGAGQHDFTEFLNYTPLDLRMVDDGDYHGGLQDFYLGVEYRAIDGAFSVSPHVAYGVPVSNYPVYGSAVIGKHLREIPVGVAIGISPYFSDWYIQADISYVFSEDLLGVNLDYWLTYLSAGYYLTPRFAPRVFVSKRYSPDGLAYPEDFPTDADWDTEKGFRHDQMFKHGYVNGGIGFDYVVSDRYQVSATWYRTINPDNIAEVDNAFTLAVRRQF